MYLLHLVLLAMVKQIKKFYYIICIFYSRLYFWIWVKLICSLSLWVMEVLFLDLHLPPSITDTESGSAMDNSGSYTWVCPANVYWVSSVCIGGGGHDEPKRQRCSRLVVVLVGKDIAVTPGNHMM